MKAEVEISEEQIAGELKSWGEKKLMVFLMEILGDRFSGHAFGSLQLGMVIDNKIYLVADSVDPWVDDSPLCELGECDECGTLVISWAKRAWCPTCSNELHLT